MASELLEHWRIAQAELLFFHYASFSLSLSLFRCMVTWWQMLAVFFCGRSPCRNPSRKGFLAYFAANLNTVFGGIAYHISHKHPKPCRSFSVNMCLHMSWHSQHNPASEI